MGKGVAEGVGVAVGVLAGSGVADGAEVAVGCKTAVADIVGADLVSSGATSFCVVSEQDKVRISTMDAKKTAIMSFRYFLMIILRTS